LQKDDVAVPSALQIKETIKLDFFWRMVEHPALVYT